MQFIKSKDNSFVKELCLLVKNKKQRVTKSLFVIEGLRICKDAVLSGAEIKTVLFTEEFKSKHTEEAQLFCDYCDDIRLISNEVSEKIGETVNSQGVFCLCKIPKLNKGLCGSKFIVLENIQDPGNLGTVVRTAEAFKMDGVVLIGNCVDLYCSKVLRSTMGTVFRIPIVSFSSVSDAKSALKELGCKIYGAVLESGSKKLSKTEFNGKNAVLIGNEANGLTENAKDICDEFVFIEMSGSAESLNAAVAASVIMWEMQKG